MFTFLISKFSQINQMMGLQNLSFMTVFARILCLLRDDECEEHTISLALHVLSLHPNLILQNTKSLDYCVLKIVGLHFVRDELLCLPSDLEISLMDLETCSVHDSSSESFTFPCTCIIPPLLLQKRYIR